MNDNLVSSETNECEFKKKLIYLLIGLLLLSGILAFSLIYVKRLQFSEFLGPVKTAIPGKEYYNDFLIDNVLEFQDSTELLHYHIYIPKKHNARKLYALYITLPGYGAYYFQGVAINLKIEHFAEEAKKYNDDMIIVAPQPNDWGQTSKNQIIKLTEYMLYKYSIDPRKVYISGYSGGGETLSLVVSERPELYSAALHVSSKWDGNLKKVSDEKLPLYFAIGENDEYYSSMPVKSSYNELKSYYTKNGIDSSKINEIVILDVKNSTYFIDSGITNQHGGGCLFAYDKTIMSWLFKDRPIRKNINYTLNSKVDDVLNDPYFYRFGRLLFPFNRGVSGSMTLSEISSNRIFIYYNYIDAQTTVNVIQSLHDNAASGNRIFFDIYDEEEKKRDQTKENSGLFFFSGKKDEKFAIINAGGAFKYVGAMHDSFPHALELSKRGYNGFALIYRTDKWSTDLGQAIKFLYDNAESIGIRKDKYSLWGGSAGARMAATLGNRDQLSKYGRKDISQASAIVMQYTGYTSVSRKDPPTYACVGKSDGIANWRTMENRLNQLKSFGIQTEFHAYSGLPHGFGLGKGTIAWGWINDAINFWEKQSI